METQAQNSARGYLGDLSTLFESVEVTAAGGARLELDQAVTSAVALLLGLGARKAMLIGNGGSAAIVSHMQNDMFKMVGLRAIVFTEQPLLTALSNDDGYETVFRQPVTRWAEPGDLLVAVSSSGESNNIVTAAAAARERGCRLLTFSGFKPGNRLRQAGDLNFYVPSMSYGHVELTHQILGHCITDFAAARLKAAR